MLVDFNSEASSGLLGHEYDACVIGAGPAGITLARKLAGYGRKVLLLEGGGLEYSLASQDLYKGDVVGHPYYPLDVSRLRFFGGTSNHWSGWCRWLDSYDFDAIPIEGCPTWPISREDISEYESETSVVLDLEQPEFDRKAIDGLPNHHELLMQFSPPTHFGRKYQEEIKSSTEITCLYNANVTDIRIDTASGWVMSVHVTPLDQSRKAATCRARTYVLAAGGIENPGIMLNANKQVTSGIGNTHGLVGRYFQEHPIFEIGEYLVATRDQWGAWMKFISPTLDALLRNKSLNINFRLYSYKQEAPSVKRYIRDAACSNPLIYDLVEALYRGPDCSERPIREAGVLEATWEQVPNRDSRVFLGEDLDQFGRRRLCLDWKITAFDMATLRTNINRLVKESLQSNFLRVKLQDWVLDENDVLPTIDQGHEVGGSHHMGTTRMADSASLGVVDKNCRVFGHENLYVAGSSVFPRGGFANPTYTIVQLALRLGDHLDVKLRS